MAILNRGCMLNLFPLNPGSKLCVNSDRATIVPPHPSIPKPAVGQLRCINEFVVGAVSGAVTVPDNLPRLCF